MRRVELLVVGAGPAGLAAAGTARGLGLGVELVDEQPLAGGQIYRAVTSTPVKDEHVLDADYHSGAALVDEFRRSGAVHRPSTTVWSLDPNGEVGLSGGGRAELVHADHIILATGAMERPMPFAGWTLPGVMTAGAAQILIKSSGLVPVEPVVLAGCGPLLLLVAAQILAAGGQIALLLETIDAWAWWRAARHLPRALRAAGELAKGRRLYRKLEQAGVPIVRGITAIEASGDRRLERVAWQTAASRGEIDTSMLLTHHGVVPDTQATRSLGVAHRLDAAQQAWRPVVDAFGATTLQRYAVAGDGAGIAGAKAACLRGRLAAIDAARRLDRIDVVSRDRLARPLLRQLGRAMAVRPLLDALYAPPASMVDGLADSVLVCRCERVSAGEIRAAARLGCEGPSQLKAFTRCGMGPCQGRQCGDTVTALIAAARGLSAQTVGTYRVRPPLKPLRVGELAGVVTDGEDSIR